MRTSKTEITVEGEPLDLLMQAIGHIDHEVRPNGSVTFEARLEPALGNPFQRALMRVEAELLRAEADEVGRPGASVKAPEERSAEAFVALITRVMDASMNAVGRAS